jgi:hypothetical protein
VRWRDDRVEIHSENKDGTAAHFKGGFGFHPLFCFVDGTGETLAARLRPENATANDATDLLAVVDDTICQLPAHIAAGHRPGDEPRSGGTWCGSTFRLGRRYPRVR